MLCSRLLLSTWRICAVIPKSLLWYFPAADVNDFLRMHAMDADDESSGKEMNICQKNCWYSIVCKGVGSLPRTQATLSPWQSPSISDKLRLLQEGLNSYFMHFWQLPDMKEKPDIICGIDDGKKLVSTLRFFGLPFNWNNLHSKVLRCFKKIKEGFQIYRKLCVSIVRVSWVLEAVFCIFMNT